MYDNALTPLTEITILPYTSGKHEWVGGWVACGRIIPISKTGEIIPIPKTGLCGCVPSHARDVSERDAFRKCLKFLHHGENCSTVF